MSKEEKAEHGHVQKIDVYGGGAIKIDGLAIGAILIRHGASNEQAADAANAVLDYIAQCAAEGRLMVQ